MKTLAVSMMAGLLVVVAAVAETWRVEALAPDGSNIYFGRPVERQIVWNLNGQAPIDFGGITWGTDHPPNVVLEQATWEENIQAIADRYTDVNLKEIMRYAYQVSYYAQVPSRQVYTITGLTPGVEYRVQFLTDTEPAAAGWTADLTLDGSGATKSPWAYLETRLWECIFTATDSDADLMFESDGRPYCSAVLMQTTAELAPSTVVVVK